MNPRYRHFRYADMCCGGFLSFAIRSQSPTGVMLESAEQLS